MSSKQAVYEGLEATMLDYADLATIRIEPIDEPLVPIVETSELTALQIGEDMLSITGDLIYVRQNVAERLGQASLLLADRAKGAQLQVVYGYRALSIQKRLFQKFYDQFSEQYSGDELIEQTHRLIAQPTVAGHPTGGAVDIQIIRDRQPLDFGTTIWEFVPDSYTFSPFVSEAAGANRQLLRRIMVDSGFAPFDGEWWHFSYGDKEWAKYYDRDFALYEQVHVQPDRT